MGNVQHSPTEFNEDIGLDVMVLAYFARNSNRSCLVRAFMVKKEGETADKFFPMLIYGELDYEQKYYSRKIIISNYREEINKHIDLDILRRSLKDDQEAKEFAIESLQSGKATENTESAFSA